MVSERRRVGRSGLEVGPIGLGTMTWGRDTDQHEAGDMLRAFVDAGGNLVDIAPWHGDGAALEIVGGLAAEVGRGRLVLALRCGAAPVGGGGVGRGQLLDQLDASLRLLGTDHVDLWMPQGPRDPGIPMDEVVAALRFAQDTGRARYVGLSHFGAWDAATATALIGDGLRPVAVEEAYSLLDRSAERTFGGDLPGAGLGLIAHSPVAGGVLTGKYRNATPPDSRGASAHLRDWVRPYLGPDLAGIVEAVARTAEGLERTPAQVALAWVLMQAGISAAVIGPRSMRQLGPLLDTDRHLPRELAQVLDEVSRRAI